MRNIAVLRTLGFFSALLILALDQLSKALLLARQPSGGFPIEITTFFNLVVVQNHGISFGLFSHLSSMGPLILLLATSGIAIFLGFWLWRARYMPLALALGIIIGGAAGNIVDRLRIGSVTDFLDFHLGSYHWPAFNLADSFIFIGVVILSVVSIVHPTDKNTQDS